MIKVLPRNILRIIVLVIFQVFILNNIQLSGFINPYFYVLFILLLPFETPGWLLLSLGFTIGLVIDLFSNTPGLHASATVFMAFLRPIVLDSFAPRDGYEPGTFPRIYYYGFGWFFQYSLILILAHHIFLFYMEVFRLSDFFLTLWRAILSTVFTLFLVVISQYFIYRK
ncbi:MAG: rod shape-determining protein MreD [Bacteroidales bacterium]